MKEHKMKPMSEEMSRKVILSSTEADRLTSREIKCPYCQRFLLMAYNDGMGHIQVKCNNCKAIVKLNLGYFRRSKRSRSLAGKPKI